MYSYDAHSEQSLMPHPSLVHMQVQLGISWMTTTWKMHSSIEFLIYSSLPHSKSKSRSKFLSKFRGQLVVLTLPPSMVVLLQVAQQREDDLALPQAKNRKTVLMPALLPLQVTKQREEEVDSQ